MRKLDNQAVDMIPFRLIISIAIVAAITVVITFGYVNLKITLAEKQIEDDCRAVESKLYSMIASGVTRDIYEINAAEGTKRVHTFNLPENINYLSFGVDPDPDNNGILETGITQDGTAIFYKVDGGCKKVIWFDDDFKFREGKYDGSKWIIDGKEEGFIIKKPGSVTLDFEYARIANQEIILIQKSDNI